MSVAEALAPLKVERGQRHAVPSVAPVLLQDILDDRARQTPERVAVRSRDVTWTYAELRSASRAWATCLARHGVRRGDRVLVLGEYSAQTVAVLYAVARLGACYVVASADVRPYLVRHLLADAEPAAVLVADEVGTDMSGPVLRLSDPPSDVGSGDPGGGLSVDPVGLTYTSGSTAMPKAVVSTHQQVLFAATAIQSVLGYRADDVVFNCLPLSFDYGLYQVYLACLAGAELVMGTRADAGPPLLNRLRETGATVFPAVPTTATVLARLLSRPGAALPRLRMVTNTGAALPPSVVAELLPVVVPMFGLTECKRVSILPPDEVTSRPGSVGRPLPDTEVVIVGADGSPLPAGEVGELVVRGGHVMAGYWRAPELTAATFRRDDLGDVRLHTGDLCRVDADGYLYFVGRRDDLYKQHGVRMSAIEVEAAAVDVPGVELAVLLPPNGERGAVLVVTGTVDSYGVLAGLADRLEPDRMPERCVVLGELPLRTNGKIDRRALDQVVR
jgi:acyl-CoA synthetase (AMP-forming)/AMP-acid ligase II